MKGVFVTSQVKAVIFDHGGVLSRGGGKGTNEEVASRAMGLSEVIDIPDLNESLKRGKISNEQFVEGINQLYPHAPRRLTNAMWNDVYVLLRPEPLSYKFAYGCMESGFRVGILSNINPAIAERLSADGSYNGFDPLVLSCYTGGFAKADPEIYAMVEDGLPGIAPEETLLLDDQLKCVNGALSRGWQAILVTSPEQMVQDAGMLLGLG